MEGKRVPAAALCLMLVLLSGQQQQVAAMAFCQCYKQCYSNCKEDRYPGWLCTINCMEYCNIVQPPAAVITAAFGAGDCSKICLTSICDEGPAGADGACVHDCSENWNRYKNKHT
ncbi:hypothetical protein ACP4OV_021822 [Aristida adscensionis]